MGTTQTKWITIAVAGILAAGCGADFHWASQTVAVIGTPGNLVVTENIRYHQATANPVVPFDFTTAPVDVLVLDGAGNFTSVPSTPLADGGLSFNVPAGIYYVHQGTSYTVTSQHKVDLSFTQLGRPGVAQTASNSAPAVITAWSLTPWINNYQDPAFEVNVPAIGDSASLSLDAIPAPGQTQLTDVTGTYFDSLGNVPAFDPASGDPSYLNEFQSVTVNALGSDGGTIQSTATTVVASGQLVGLGFAPDGGSLLLASTLSPTPMNQIILDWPRSIYGELSSEFGAGARVTFTSFGLFPVAYGYIDSTWVGFSGSLFNLFPDDSVLQDLNSMDIVYGNPYPASWGVASSVTVGYQRTLPGAGVAGAVLLMDGGTPPDYRLNTFYAQSDTLASLPSTSLGLRMTPPSDLRINGTPTGPFETIPMTHVTFEWAPPAVGTPNAYLVLVREVTASGSLGSVRYTNTRVAGFSVTGDTTQVVMPPGLFQSGHTYLFRVLALDVNSTHFDSEPNLGFSREPNATAEMGTGLVTAL